LAKSAVLSYKYLNSTGVRVSDILLILVLKNPSPFPITIRLYLPVSQAFLISSISSDITFLNSSISSSCHLPGSGLLIDGRACVLGFSTYHLYVEIGYALSNPRIAA
jgi:hypothetical protein